MAWTRAGQVGPQLNTIAEWPASIGSGSAPTVSSTKAHLAEQTYSVRDYGAATDSQSAGLTFAAATQARAGVWLNHNGSDTSSSHSAVIYRWTSSVGNTNYLRWKGSTGLLEIMLAGSAVTSVAIATAGLSTVDTWYHVGIVIEASATVGTVTVYVNGVNILAATGQDTGTSISEMYFAGTVTGGITWKPYAYFSDFYVDTGSGNSIEAPPKKSFLWAVADGNGYSSQWTGSDGNSTDNYLLVDDTTPDDDTTYVKAESANLIDGYACAAVTLPSGYSIIAAIPTALAKRAGTTEELILGTYDGSTAQLDSSQAPAASYGAVWSRFETQPDASAWDETDFNASQAVIKSAGTF